jgi:hypothetical protein
LSVPQSFLATWLQLVCQVLSTDQKFEIHAKQNPPTFWHHLKAFEIENGFCQRVRLISLFGCFLTAFTNCPSRRKQKITKIMAVRAHQALARRESAPENSKEISSPSFAGRSSVRQKQWARSHQVLGR